MSDLVERLKFAAQWSETEIDIAPPDLLKQAADEIERLRLKVAELKFKLAMILSDAQGI